MEVVVPPARLGSRAQCLFHLPQDTNARLPPRRRAMKLSKKRRCSLVVLHESGTFVRFTQSGKGLFA
jgi:hypothetical protein